MLTSHVVKSEITDIKISTCSFNTFANNAQPLSIDLTLQTCWMKMNCPFLYCCFCQLDYVTQLVGRGVDRGEDKEDLGAAPITIICPHFTKLVRDLNIWIGWALKLIALKNMSLQSLHECPWLSLSAEPFLSFIIWNISVKHLSEANKEKERASHRGWVKIYQITLQEQPEIQPLVNICQNITDFNQFIKWSFWMFHY